MDTHQKFDSTSLLVLHTMINLSRNTMKTQTIRNQTIILYTFTYDYACFYQIT